MDRKRIDQAAAQAGIAADFINAHGKRQAIEPETKRKLLAAMSRADAAQEGGIAVAGGQSVLSGRAAGADPGGRRRLPVGCSVKTANAWARVGAQDPDAARRPAGGVSPIDAEPGARAVAMPSDRRAEALLRAGRLADRRRNCGAPAFSCIRCVPIATGHRRFRRFCV